MILGVYALLWQQVIKKFELSIAYANKAITLLWVPVWGIVLFHEQITIGNAVGIVMVMIGIFIMNSGEAAGDESVTESGVEEMQKRSNNLS